MVRPSCPYHAADVLGCDTQRGPVEETPDDRQRSSRRRLVPATARADAALHARPAPLDHGGRRRVAGGVPAFAIGRRSHREPLGLRCRERRGAAGLRPGDGGRRADLRRGARSPRAAAGDAHRRDRVRGRSRRSRWPPSRWATGCSWPTWSTEARASWSPPPGRRSIRGRIRPGGAWPTSRTARSACSTSRAARTGCSRTTTTPTSRGDCPTSSPPRRWIAGVATGGRRTASGSSPPASTTVPSGPGTSPGRWIPRRRPERSGIRRRGRPTPSSRSRCSTWTVAAWTSRGMSMRSRTWSRSCGARTVR